MIAPRWIPALGAALVVGGCELDRPADPGPPPVCDASDPKQCFERGMSLRDTQPKKAEEALDLACRAALPEACNNLGLLYLEPPAGFAGDLERASMLFRLACDHHVAQSCHSLAGMYFGARHVGKDDKKALELWQKACTMGHLPACDESGTALANGRGAAADKKAAMKLWEKACDEGGVLHACAALGLNLALGIDDVKKDPDRGGKLLLAACNAQYAPACKDLGGLHLGKVLPEADPEKGLVLLRNACHLSYGEGCNELGVAHAQGIGTERAPVEAAKLFERACNLRSLTGCQNLAIALLHGDGVEADPERAGELLVKACEGGLAASCARAEELGLEVPNPPPSAASGAASASPAPKTAPAAAPRPAPSASASATPATSAPPP